MPIPLNTEKDLRPIYQAKPDMRFATTFISNKYRDYAVNGESMMDKATGEIFTKRPEDGRVVSFFQNKKYMSELMLDLRVMLNNNSEFRYPNSDNFNSCYISTDYDMMSLYEDKDISITDNDQVIPNTADSRTQIKFNLSKDTNGFFCRMTSRDSDKAVIEWITNQYNAICKNYSGNNADFIAEKNKFNTIEKWEDSNAIIEYELQITTDGNTTSFDLVDYIRINEESCILFPVSLGTDVFSSASQITVMIKSIKYDKIHFMLSHIEDLSTSFNDGLSKFIYPDKSIFIRYCNICSFVDDPIDIRLLGNEFIVALMDVPFLRRYMMKMGKLVTESNVVLSANRPSDDIWGTNSIWAEHIRDVFKSGYTVNMNCEVNLKQLEDYLAENDNTDYVNISTTINDTDIYGKEV